MGQPNDVRVQAANAVAQALGQHRDDAVDEVNAVPALERLTVERASRRDVSRDVRDVDAEFPFATRQFLDIDRVIEIARVIGIDRDDELLAQIFALRGSDSGSTLSGISFGFRENGRRETRAEGCSSG